MLHLMCALHTLGVKNMEALGQRRHDDRGQTAAEYLGIIVVVAAIVVAITGTDIGTTIKDAITTKINEIAG
jgi:pilus assembly protein Flp/PilA